MGALFNIHQLQKDALPKPLKGDNDWTQLTSEFATGDRSTITIKHALRRVGSRPRRGVV
jgi:hypothetical protein